MQVKKIFNNYILVLIFILITVFNINSQPFLGGIFYTYNYFENDKFNTVDTLSFFLSQKINDKVYFYSRFTGGFKFYTDILRTEDMEAYSIDLENFYFIPSIDLLFFEFRSKKIDRALILDENDNIKKIVNYDLFLLKIGRIYVNHSSGFLLRMRGDGLDTFFTIQNFKLRLFGFTNSFEYLPFFNFEDPSSVPVFTRWDKKRYPPLSNRLLDNDHDGFISDIKTPDYNFFFKNKLYTDYSIEEKERLNNLRYASVLAGRIFTGFSIDLFQFYFQNFSLGFLANIDLIPNEFVLVYPSHISNVPFTFGGKYNSFYISFNANGRIAGNFYYNFEAVYQTGTNASCFNTGSELIVDDKIIQSFSLNAKLSYFFNHATTPSIHIEFAYGHGDENVDFIDDAVVIWEQKNPKYKFDHNFRSPTSPKLGYALEPKLSNLAVIILTNSVKPFGFVKNEVFSRFLIETALLIFMRPIIKGDSFLPEKPIYQKDGEEKNSPIKAYLGTEIDIILKWQVFSDLNIELKNAVFIPNGKIHYSSDANYPDLDNYTPYWRIGLIMSMSF
ncbi:MAG: alginate export family protein [Spirochaetes bacterium]|nr:alginate export family protein [Spirochaetota bacterium]